jgi:hypothetical protein
MQLVLNGHDRVYYGTDTRAGEFVAGALLAVWVSSWRASTSRRSRATRRRRQTTIAVVGGVASLLLLGVWNHVGLGSGWLYAGGFLGVGFLCAAVVAAAIVPGPVRAVCSLRPFRAIGIVSYGLYLYHWPVFLWLNGPRTGLDGWSLFAVRMTVTTLLALASYVLVEQPIRTGKTVKRPVVFWTGLVAAGAVVTLAVAVLVPVPRASEVIDAADFASASKAFAQPTGGASTAPRATDAAGTPEPLRVLVVGDSSGLLFAYGMSNWGKADGRVTVESHAFLDCPLARGGSFRHSADEVPTTVSDYCNTVPDRWYVALDHDPDVVIVMGGPSSMTDRQPAGSDQWLTLGDPAWDGYFWDELNRDADLLTRPGVPILWFDQPYMQRDGGLSTGRLDEWSDPARADVYNRMVERLDRERANVTRFHWADFMNGLTVDQFNSYSPDGVHVDPVSVQQLLGEQRLWSLIERTYLQARADATQG